MADAIIPVETPIVEGVKIPRHELDLAVVRILRACGRLLDEIEGSPPSDKDSAMCLSATAKAVETVDRCVRGLLAEQRERAKMAAGRPPLTDEEYRAQLEQMAEQSLQLASDERLLAILDERAARRH